MPHCFVIAEAGVNHNGDLATAKCLVDAAKFVGAGAVKFQTYLPDKICRDDDPEREMLTKLALPLGDFVKLSEYCRTVGINFMSTPECPETLHFLINECGVQTIKIGSGDLTNQPLLEAAGAADLPIFLSTGMATVREISRALASIQATRHVTIMHCVSLYPTCVDEANLWAIKTLQHVYPVNSIGYSDHTLGDLAPLAAVAMGVTAIEKHITLDVRMLGPDHHMSMEPTDFLEMIQKIRQLERMFGTGDKKPCEAELEIAQKVRKGADGKRGIAA